MPTSRYFGELPLHSVLRFGTDNSVGRIIVYTIGNPLIARGIVGANPRAAYSIPPRLLVLETECGARARTVLPPAVGEGAPGFDEQLLVLDANLRSPKGRMARTADHCGERGPRGYAVVCLKGIYSSGMKGTKLDGIMSTRRTERYDGTCWG